MDKKLIPFLLITLLSFSVAFMVGCAPEGKAEDRHEKNESEELKDKLSRKESRINHLEQELESKQRKLKRTEFYSDILLEMNQNEGVRAHEVLSEDTIKEIKYKHNLWDFELQVDIPKNDKSTKKEFTSDGEVTINSSEFVIIFSGDRAVSYSDLDAHGVHGAGEPPFGFYGINDIKILDDVKVHDKEAAEGATGFSANYKFEDISDSSNIEIEITPELKDYFRLDTTNLIINVEK